MTPKMSFSGKLKSFAKPLHLQKGRIYLYEEKEVVFVSINLITALVTIRDMGGLYQEVPVHTLSPRKD